MLMILFAENGEVELSVRHIAIGEADNILACLLCDFITAGICGQKIVIRAVE